VAKRVAAEVLVDLRRRFDRLAPRDPERGRLMIAAMCTANSDMVEAGSIRA
jgi:hypothetical protein